MCSSLISKRLFGSFILLLLLPPIMTLAPIFINVRITGGSHHVSASLDLNSKATNVVVGHVESTEAIWNKDEGTIYTYVKIFVEEYLKGNNVGNEIAIRHRGGEVGNIGLRDSSAPQFVHGERVKLFLTPIARTNEFAVVGGQQGKISLSQVASAGYVYEGLHWSKSDLPVRYYIDEKGTPDIAGTVDEFLAVQRSFQTWEDDAGSYMNYTYAGTTARSGSSRDGFSVVSWQHIDGSSATLAETSYWYEPSSGLLTEFDIVFDEDEAWSVSGEAGKMDLQNIGTHEVGHTLVLGDLYDPADSEQTMYGYSNLGETKKRDLYTGDIAGIRFIYGLPTNTYTISTNPTGLQVEVDGTFYTTPHSFSWYQGTQHFVSAISPQNPSHGKRYVFGMWSDGEAQSHSITVGTEYSELTASYITQYQVTFTFKTDDNTQRILPTRIKLLANPPNNTPITLTTYSNIWLKDEQWIITEILWQGNNVVPLNHPTLNLSPAVEWGVGTRVYAIGFEQSSNDNTGSAFPTNQTSFRLGFLNGTLSDLLIPTRLYYIQNGTTSWQSIIWQNTEVAPADVTFDASNGNPSVNCLIYDFTITVTDPFGLPVQGASVSVTKPNGDATEALTKTDGTAIFTLIPQGRFTAKIHFISQTTTISGDVAEKATHPPEAKITFSLLLIMLILVPATAAFALIVVAMKRRTRKNSGQRVTSV